MYSIYQLHQYSGRNQLEKYSSDRHLPTSTILNCFFQLVRPIKARFDLTSQSIQIKYCWSASKAKEPTRSTVTIFSVDIFLHCKKNIELLQFVICVQTETFNIFVSIWYGHENN